MQNIGILKQGHLNCLNPLLKWRILDIESLRSQADVPLSYDAFCRIVRNLEARKIINTFRDSGNRKKFVHLSHIGVELLAADDSMPVLAPETLNHDKWVSQIVLEMLKRSWIHDFKLEHEIIGKNRFKLGSSLVPDASLEGEFNGREFTMALELEINRKNFPRIVEKARQYAHEKTYDYFLYYFPNKSLMDTYAQVINEKVNENVKNKFMLFWGDESTPLDKSKGVALGREHTLGSLFEKCK
jgi:hypothetical protein